MNIAGTIRKSLLATVSLVAMASSLMGAPTDKPKITDTLNDFNPEYPIGVFVQEIVSNQVVSSVILTNGVLTVGSETINIAQPSHDVVETNVVDGALVITTNTYYTVYEDGLEKTLKAYATNEKITSIVTNGIGEVTTNWTKVAYLSDIPPDEKKADKVIQTWEFIEPNVDVVLSRDSNTIAPLSYWRWAGDKEAFQSIDLYYKGGSWHVSQNGGAFVSTEGAFTNDVVEVGGFTFIATNRADVMVVYSDQLEDVVSGKLDQYVAKTNLVPIAEQITEERLQTINGIADTLRGIKQVVNGITGIPTMSFTFSAPSQNFRCEMVGAEMVVPGDSVEVDWGDGSEGEIVSLPTNHVYSGYVDSTLTVTVKGFVRGILGDSEIENRPFIYLYDLDGGRFSPSSLTRVKVDSSMPLEIIGDNAFSRCTGLTGDLSFLPPSITNLGDRCFAESGISSLNGMPLGVSKIPYRAFASTANLTSLSGMPPSIATIGDSAFLGSRLTSLDGISSAVSKLGDDSFTDCERLSDIMALSSTRVTSIPFGCFTRTGLTSLDGLPYGITSFEAKAFMGSGLTSLSGIPSSLKRIDAECFQSCASLQTADMSMTSVSDLGYAVFEYADSLESIMLPSSFTGGADFLRSAGGSGTLSVTVVATDIYALTNASGFAWGLRNSDSPPGSSVFIATDGQLVSDGSGGWTVNLTSTAFSLSGLEPGRHTITIGEIEPTQTTRKTYMAKRSAKRAAPSIATGTYLIDWGDGSPLDSESSHTYNLSSPSDITIKVLGALDSISGDSRNPFVTVDGNPTNKYLTAVDFGGAVGIKRLGPGTFRNSPNLTYKKVKGLGSSLTSLGDECFAYCSSMSLANHLNDTSITELPDGCFRGTKLAGIGYAFYTRLTSIGADCFRDCTNLVLATALSSSLTTIGDNAFYGCSNLRDANFITSTGIREIPDGCFQNCASITNLPPLESISRIGDNAFANCSKLVDLSLPRGISIGDRAFYGCGTDPGIPDKTDEDGFKFKLLFDCGEMTYLEASQTLGLQDGDVTDTRTGIDPTVTKFLCNNGDLLFNNGEQIRRWEVVLPAIEFELSQVTNGTTFMVGSTRAYDGASLVWNWGDGFVDRWITKSPPSHTYTNTVPRNYIVKVKGLLQSISSTSTEAGAYIRPAASAENPFLVGFKLADETPLQAIGNHSFSRCPNLKNIDTLNLPRARGAPALPVKRDASKTRLENLSASTTRGLVTYGEGCFARSGIEDLSGLPADLSLLPRAIFAYNTNLNSIATLPKYILDVEDGAFRGDKNIVNLYGWPMLVGYVSPYCFAECSGLNSLYGIEDAPITAVGEGAFYGCTNLTSLYGLPASLVTIGANAFQGSGVSSLSDIPHSVTNIGETAFAQCMNLYTTDGISTNILSLPKMAFLGCTNIREIVSLSENLSDIGDMCFIQLPNLTNVVLGANIKKIGIAALGGCGVDVEPQADIDGNMISCTITFPSLSIAEIRSLWSTNFATTLSTTKLAGWDGFIAYQNGEWRDNVNTITFRVNVKTGSEVCLGSIDMEEGAGFGINWGDAGTYVDSGNGFSHVYSKAGTYDISLIGRIYGLASSLPPRPFLFSTNSTISVTAMEVGNNVGLNYLGESCFRGYSTWTNLLDMSGTKICTFGPNCFEGCTTLKDLSGIPLGLSTISSNAFKNCTSLTDISALTNSTIAALGDSAFENCTSLTSIVGCGGFITNIPDRCFYNCRRLTSLEGLSGTLSLVGNEAFASCTSLSNIVALSNTVVEAIGEKAFAGCSSLANIEGFPETLESIGERCFMGCTALRTLEWWGGNIGELPTGCFEGCTALYSITNLPSFITIGEECFKGCTSLSNGKGYWTSQGYVARETFMGCPTLESLSFIDDQYEAIKVGAFNGCSNLSIVTLPTALTNLESQAFANCVRLSELVINIGNITIANGALSNIGSRNVGFVDESGNTIKATVWMKEYTCDEIMALPNFPFGAPSTTTRFVGNDGYVVGNGKYRDALEMELTALAGDKFRLGNLVTKSGKMVAVAWGDGTGTNNISSGTVEHVYDKPGTYTIKVFGELDRIAAPDSTSSFIAKYNGATLVANNTAVKSVRIPESSSLTVIGACAFNGCSAITNVAVANGKLTTISTRAFDGCSGIEEFSLDESPITEFGDYAFAQTKFFSDLEWLPQTLTKIGADCFNGCTSLNDIGRVMEEREIVSIGARAFGGCSQLGTDAVMQYWPTNVVVLGTNTFASCSRLSRLYIQNTCIGIRDNALNGIGANAPPVKDETGREYRAFVFITHKTCEEVRSAAFSGTGSSVFPFGARTDTKFVCADGYISYDNRSWANHQYDMSIILSDVAAGATVTIRNTVPAGGEAITWSFGDGHVMENVTAYPITHTYASASSAYQISAMGHIDMMSGSSVSVPWISMSNGKVKSVIINESCAVKDIGNYCFSGISSLESVDIYSRVVTNIGESAFRDCSSLTSIRFPRNYWPYTYPIGDYALMGCTSLKEVDLSSGNYTASRIGKYAFSGCTSLDKISIRLSGNTITIGENAFHDIGTSSTDKVNQYGFRHKAEVFFTSQWEADELRNSSSSLWGAPSTTVFPTPDGFVGYDATWKSYEYAVTGTFGTGRKSYRFYDKGVLTGGFGGGVVSVKIGNMVNVSEIGHNAFSGQSSLTTITRSGGSPLNITRIGQKAFYGCGSLSAVPNFGTDVTSIDADAFNGCAKLEIESQTPFPLCKFFGERAFMDCKAMMSISWMNQNAVVRQQCFQGCETLQSISGYPANGDRNVPAKCFYRCFSLRSLNGLPSSITNIDTWAFATCTNLLSLSGIPESLVSIGDCVFGDVYDPVYFLYDNAHHIDMTNARYESGTVVLPSTLKSVGVHAFCGLNNKICENMTFDMTGAKLTYFNFGSFEGGAPYVQSSMTLNELDAAYDHSSYSPVGSSILGTDGIYERYEEGAYSSYRKQRLSNTPLLIRMEDFPMGTSFQCAGFGDKIGYAWGDGTCNRGRTNHMYSGSMDDANFYVINPFSAIPNLSNGPVVSCGSHKNEYVKFVLVGGTITHIGNNAFEGMTGCSEIRIYGALPSFGTGVFSRLGESLALKTMAGTPIQYKAIVYIEDVSCDELLSAGVPSGTPSTVVFSCMDGYVYHDGSTWATHKFVISATLKWAEIGYEDTAPVSYSYFVKFPSYSWGRLSFITDYIVDNISPVGTPPERPLLNAKLSPLLRGIPYGSMTYYPIQKWQYDSLRSDGFSKYTEERRTEVQVAGARTTVWVGPFKFSNNGSGSVSIDNGPKERIESGQKLLIGGRNGAHTGYVKHSLKIYGMVERIEGFVNQNDSPTGLPPLVTSLDLSGCSSLRYINSFASVSASPKDCKIPNTVEGFGDGCFANRSDITTLTWLPTSLTAIPTECFSGCKKLKDLYGIERCTKLTSIGSWCFMDCTSLSGTLADQKANKGCFPSSVTTIYTNPFLNVCYGNASREFAVCMRGKTIDQILGVDNVRWSANQANVGANNGSVGRLKWYGTDGYIKDVKQRNSVSEWQKVKQNTGL